MPLVVGGATSATGWKPVTDLRVGNTPVQRAVLGTETGVLELWRRVSSLDIASASTTITAPAWALYADIIAIGGGGGGSGGNNSNASGNGGHHGGWKSTVWAVIPGRKLTVTIGSGGSGGSGGSAAAGSPGSATTVTVSDRDWKVEAPGGAGGTGTGGGAGETAGSYTLTGYGEDLVVAGGSAQSATEAAGNAPGGGGGPGKGANIFGAKAGGTGARGQAWIRFRSY